MLIVSEDCSSTNRFCWVGDLKTLLIVSLTWESNSGDTLEPRLPATFNVPMLLSTSHCASSWLVGFNRNGLLWALANLCVAILPALSSSVLKYTVPSELMTFCSVLGK